jgi:hypothetical protein
VEAVFMLGEVE